MGNPRRLGIIALLLVTLVGGLYAGLSYLDRHKGPAPQGRNAMPTQNEARLSAEQPPLKLHPPAKESAAKQGNFPPAPPALPAARESAQQRRLREMETILRRDGIPEEDIQNMLRGLEGRRPKDEPGYLPTWQDLTPAEREAELRASLESSGVPPIDIDNMVKGLVGKDRRR